MVKADWDGTVIGLLSKRALKHAGRNLHIIFYSSSGRTVTVDETRPENEPGQTRIKLNFKQL